eukprot:CAMPEP_0202885958 /NCGR_PEP_ID=MMETSP1391-20130828/41930_1 /ASSEMBLY_ACC=CAM_ASM_000867 /TAXON_ID=1034604 /ORGANISM="Chlamydomonas leiostraca, Strain SAG 11-49" /LENGTH=321 /DNA_ID=CAMNT_0049569221 /DNA_START=25 /DNA_END=990 /DNA_ORIENTATION=+
MKLSGKHVLITGGSAGIGLAIARELVTKECANVTLVARTASKLEEAVKELQAAAKAAGSSSRISSQAADVTVPEQVRKAVDAAEAAQGPVDVLIANAGSAHVGYFHELDMAAFESSMKLNYFGVVAAAQALYPRMVARGSGHLCFVSSGMGTMGFVGYSAYAPTKYAVKGLADCLRNELLGSGVTVSLAYPPDTDTPGFAEENKSKPKETSEISALSEVFKPEVVARSIIKGLKRGSYTLPTPDMGLFLQASHMQGLATRSWLACLILTLISPLTPLIQYIYGTLMDRISRKHASARFGKLWAQQSDAQASGQAAAGREAS